MACIARCSGLMLVALLLTGCFQSQLQGPVGGATITVAPLRNPGQILLTEQSYSSAFLQTLLGFDKWTTMQAFPRLFWIGLFTIDADAGPWNPGSFYLITAKAGFDHDCNGNLKDDAVEVGASPCLVGGQWHAIVTGAQLLERGYKVSALTEAAYRTLEPDLDTLSKLDLFFKLDKMAKASVYDVNNDGAIDYEDLLDWSVLFNANPAGYRHDLTVLRRIMERVTDGEDDNGWLTALGNRAIWGAVLPALLRDHDLDGVPDDADADADNDGVANELDIDPLDPVEREDSDGDGVGDFGDAYPESEACSLLWQGDGEDCFDNVLAQENILAHAIDPDAGIVYFLVPDYPALIRYDLDTAAFLPAQPLTRGDKPIALAYAAQPGRLYIGYDQDLVTYLNGDAEQVFASVSGKVDTLAEAGDYLLVNANPFGSEQDNYLVYQHDGTLLDSATAAHGIAAPQWSASRGRMYYAMESGPEDMGYWEIDPSDGSLDNKAESPYHGNYVIDPPVLLSNDESEVLLGSGDIYDADTLEYLRSLSVDPLAAIWLGGELLTASARDGDSLMQRRDSSGQLLQSSLVGGLAVGLFNYAGDTWVITRDSERLRFRQYIADNDMDGDGVANSSDAFPDDAAAAVDTDFDGAPDDWNTGYSEQDSSSGLQLDEYPQDSACALLEHGSGAECSIATRIPAFTSARRPQLGDDLVYLLAQGGERMYRWSLGAQAWQNPLILRQDLGAVRSFATHGAHDAIYLGYSSGAITRLGTAANAPEADWQVLAKSVEDLLDTGNWLFGISGVAPGQVRDYQAFASNASLANASFTGAYSPAYTWDDSSDRFFSFSETYPDQLLSMVVDPVDAAFTDATSYVYAAQPSSGFIRVDGTGGSILLSDGSLFDSVPELPGDVPDAIDFGALGWLTEPTVIADATWVDGFLVMAFDDGSGSHVVTVWSGDASQVLHSFNAIESQAIYLLGRDASVVVVTESGGDTTIAEYVISDGEGGQGW